MKKILLLTATLVFLLIPRTQAKDLQALFYHASFFSPVEGAFVETYLKVFGPSAEYVKTPRGTYQASLEITLLFKKDDKITDFRKYNLLSGEVTDTTKGMPNFIDQQRIPLPYGNYQLELFVKDNNSKSEPMEHAEELAMEFNNKDLKFSDFQFIESYKATQSENILSKSGFDLVPYVGDFFGEGQNNLTFYIELYNLDKKIGNLQDFLYRYYLESFETNLSLSDYSKFQRQKAAAVNPILATFPINDLPSGNYNLVIEARDKNNEILESRKVFLQRSNPGILINLSDISSIDITSTFAEKITSVDSLRFYILSLIPVGTMIEIQFAKNVSGIKDISQMQKFLYNFWKVRNERNPEAEWNRYKSMVLMVEDAYKTKIRHGFETDMGRIMLKYGVPDFVIDKKHKPSSYPCIYWHYNHFEHENNLNFLFYNPNLVGTDYTLLHSDAIGEIYNTNWIKELLVRNVQLQVSDTWGEDFEEFIFKR
ncbi:MAG: GWxTD domain-containing protein [Bacteroidota bacterium]